MKSEYQLTLEGSRRSGELVLNIFSYGRLNLEAITSNVGSGIQQLENSSAREGNSKMPRRIILDFESGIGFEHLELSSHISWLLRNNPSLSAISVLEWVPDASEPLFDDDFTAWVGFHSTTPRVPSFIVYHSRWVENIAPLPTHVFTDKWSVQLSPRK